MISLVYSVREMPPQTITLTPPNPISATINPHFDPTIQLLQGESGLFGEHIVPPHVEVPVLMVQTPANVGLMVKGSHGRLPGSPIRPELCLWLLNAGVIFLGCPLHNL